MLYTVTIEAQAYADPEADGAALSQRLPDDSDDLQVGVGVDNEKRMLLTTLTFDADHAIDAQEQAQNLWATAWDEAFPDLSASRTLAVVAKPAETGSRVAVGSADPLADLDDEMADEE